MRIYTAIDFTLLYRLFAAGLAFVLFYRVVTSILSIYSTQRVSHFFYQLLDIFLIQDLELIYVFDRTSIDEIQTWIVYTSCCMQSFPIMLISSGIMTVTQGWDEHPLLLLSFSLSFILSTYAIIKNDKIIYSHFAHDLQFEKKDIFSYRCTCQTREILTGYCCYCDGFRPEYIYRIMFRIFDYQFRIFILVLLWATIGGVYLVLYLFIEFIIIYVKARKIQRYQLLTGLLGIPINYTSPEAKKFSNRFSNYRFISNYVLLVVVYAFVTLEFTDYVPISDPFERRRADFFEQNNIFNIYIYLCILSFINPWLYFGAIKGGDVIRSDDDASTNPRDPFTLISNKDFPTFLQLIVFGNKFYHGNEWVLQELLNKIEENIFRIQPKYLLLLLDSYNWDFTKISYYTKSKFFASIMRFNDMRLAKLLFDKMSDCNDLNGVESGLLYWCETKNMKADNNTFLRMIKLIQTKFIIKNFGVLTQSALLKYTILRAAKLGDLAPFHAMLAYNLAPEALSHLYLHYTEKEFSQTKSAKNAWNHDIFAEILHALHHVKKFKFNVDNNTAKCFLYWSLKFEDWDTCNELLIHQHHQKQVYSKFGTNMDPFLHLICKIPINYQLDKETSHNLCKIAEICINQLYTPLNEKNKIKVTNLMYACQILHIPLIKILVKYGPNLDIKDGNGNNYKWYIDNNYWITNNKIKEDKDYDDDENEQKHSLLDDIDDIDDVKITKKEMEERKEMALKIIRASKKPTIVQEEFIEDYEERYDDFVVTNESIPLFRSTKNDLNALFESIIKQDFQRIIDLIDKHHLDPNMPTIDGTTPLHFACEHSGALITKFLMDRGGFPFKIQSGKMFPIDMMQLNQNINDEEKEFMQRLLDVRDVDHDPFALTDERVLEVERIQLFFGLFIKWLLILFSVYFVTFATSAGLTDRLNFGYIPPLKSF